jgi:hypothetical protein
MVTKIPTGKPNDLIALDGQDFVFAWFDEHNRPVSGKLWRFFTKAEYDSLMSTRTIRAGNLLKWKSESKFYKMRPTDAEVIFEKSYFFGQKIDYGMLKFARNQGCSYALSFDCTDYLSFIDYSISPKLFDSDGRLLATFSFIGHQADPNAPKFNSRLLLDVKWLSIRYNPMGSNDFERCQFKLIGSERILTNISLAGGLTPMKYSYQNEARLVLTLTCMRPLQIPHPSYLEIAVAPKLSSFVFYRVQNVEEELPNLDSEIVEDSVLSRFLEKI